MIDLLIYLAIFAAGVVTTGLVVFVIFSWFLVNWWGWR
jgi:hypothetical protein